MKEFKITRRNFLKTSLSTAIAFNIPNLFITKKINASTPQWPTIDPNKPIKIGILFSLKGLEKVTSYKLYQTALMAIKDINDEGGILGAKLEPIIRDPESIWENYTKYAKELLDLNVNIFWGCMTSASRKATLPIIQRGGGILFYPVLYEGRECSPNLIATGSCPNQQIEISLPWMIKQKGKKTYIVGSNYIFSRTMSKQEQLTLNNHGATVLGDKYFTLGLSDIEHFKPVINEIKQKKPDFIISNLITENVKGFLQAFKKQGLKPEDIPILHTGMFESDIASIGTEFCLNHFSSMSYFQSIDSPENEAFEKRFENFLKSKPEWEKQPLIITSPMEAVYTGALICKEAMIKANSAHPQAILKATQCLELKAPSGNNIRIDPENQHTWLYSLIGKVNTKGQFDIVHKSPSWIAPEVFNPQIDPYMSCKNGGELYRKNHKVRNIRVTRKIIAQ